MSEQNGEYYTLAPEQGMCLVGNTIVNLKKIALIHKQEGKTLIYRSGVADPLALPESAFSVIKDAVFMMDDFDDDEDEEEDEDDEG